MWLVFSLLAALLWGVGQIFIKKGFTHLSPLIDNVLATIIDLLLWVPLALFMGVNFQKVLNILPLAIVAGSTYFIYYYAIFKGQVSLTGTILAAYPLTTIILSSLFLREQTSVFQKMAIGLILLGSVLIAMPKNRKVKFESWVWWAIMGALLTGFGDFLAKMAVNLSDTYTWLFTLGLAYIPLTLINIALDKKGRIIPKLTLRQAVPAVGGIVMISTGMIFFYLAFGKGLASLVTPVSSSYVVLTAVLAFFFLKERINKIQLVGIFSTSLGIILLGIV